MLCLLQRTLCKVPEFLGRDVKLTELGSVCPNVKSNEKFQAALTATVILLTNCCNYLSELLTCATAPGAHSVNHLHPQTAPLPPACSSSPRALLWVSFRLQGHVQLHSASPPSVLSPRPLPCWGLGAWRKPQNQCPLFQQCSPPHPPTPVGRGLTLQCDQLGAHGDLRAAREGTRARAFLLNNSPVREGKT